MTDTTMNKERSESLASLTDTDSAYGTESQYSGGTTHSLSRVDSRDTLLGDLEEGESESEAGTRQGPTPFTRGKHPSASTLEVETRGSYRDGDGDEDESREQNVTFKKNKKSGEVAMEIDDNTRYFKEKHGSHGESVTREGVKVARDADTGGATVVEDAVTHFVHRDSEDTSFKQNREMKEQSKETVSSEGQSKVVDQEVTSGGEYKNQKMSSQSEDTDIQIQSPDGSVINRNIKEGQSDCKTQSEDERFLEKSTEESQSGSVVSRKSKTEYEKVKDDDVKHNEHKVVTDDDGRQVSCDITDSTAQKVKDKVQESTFTEAEPDGTLREGKDLIKGTESQTSKENVSEMTDIKSGDHGTSVKSQSASTLDSEASKEVTISHSDTVVDPSGLVKKSSQDRKNMHKAAQSKSEKKSESSTSGSPDGKNGESTNKMASMSSSSSSSSSSSASSSSSSSSASSLSSSRGLGGSNVMRPILVKGSVSPSGGDKRHNQNSTEAPSAKHHRRVHFIDTALDDTKSSHSDAAPLCSLGKGPDLATDKKMTTVNSQLANGGKSDINCSRNIDSANSLHQSPEPKPPPKVEGELRKPNSKSFDLSENIRSCDLFPEPMPLDRPDLSFSGRSKLVLPPGECKQPNDGNFPLLPAEVSTQADSGSHSVSSAPLLGDSRPASALTTHAAEPSPSDHVTPDAPSHPSNQDSGSTGDLTGGYIGEIQRQTLIPSQPGDWISGTEPKRPDYVHTKDLKNQQDQDTKENTARDDKWLDPDAALKDFSSQGSILVHAHTNHIPDQLLGQYAACSDQQSPVSSRQSAVGSDPEGGLDSPGSQHHGLAPNVSRTLFSKPSLGQSVKERNQAQAIYKQHDRGSFENTPKNFALDPEHSGLDCVPSSSLGQGLEILKDVENTKIHDENATLRGSEGIIASTGNIPDPDKAGLGKFNPWARDSKNLQGNSTHKDFSCRDLTADQISDYLDTGTGELANKISRQALREISISSPISPAVICSEDKATNKVVGQTGESDGNITAEEDIIRDNTCTGHWQVDQDVRVANMESGISGESPDRAPALPDQTIKELSERSGETRPEIFTETSTICSNLQQIGTLGIEMGGGVDGSQGEDAEGQGMGTDPEEQQTESTAETPPSGEPRTESQKVITQSKTSDSENAAATTVIKIDLDHSDADHIEKEAEEESIHNEDGAGEGECCEPPVPETDSFNTNIEQLSEMNVTAMEHGLAQKNNESDVLDHQKSSSLAPLAPFEEEDEDDLIKSVILADSLINNRQRSQTMADPGKTNVAAIGDMNIRSIQKIRSGFPMERTLDLSDLGEAEMSCSEAMGAEVPYEYADTDFTEDSERTFVMNTDLDDDFSEPNFDFEEGPLPPSPFNMRRTVPGATPANPGGDSSMADKLKMISQSGVLSGHVTRKTITAHKHQSDTVNVDSLSASGSATSVKDADSVQSTSESSGGLKSEFNTFVEAVEEQDPGSGMSDVVAMDTGVITVDIPKPVSGVMGPDPDLIASIDDPQVGPQRQTGSMAAILNLPSEDICEELVNMSTLERKRKRAKSEEKTSNTGICAHDDPLSQQNVDDAVKKLRQSAEDRLKSRPSSYHSQYPQSSRRRYDWNTHHFFPDVHDLDVGILFARPGSHGDLPTQYIEDEWLQELDTGNMKDVTMETGVPGVCTVNKHHMRSDLEEDGSDSSSGDDLPKMWRKNPLHVRRKKRSERRLSQEIRANVMSDATDMETPSGPSKQGYESPRLRKKTSSPRGRRSPRRLSNPNQVTNAQKPTPPNTKTARQNSDFIQEKLEQFHELQRRRRALETTSEESLAFSKKLSDKPFNHQNTEVKLNGDKLGRFPYRKDIHHSQEDITYESQEIVSRIKKDLTQKPSHIQDSSASPRLFKPHDPHTEKKVPKPGHKSQYDFHSFETEEDRSIQYNDFYSPGNDQRKSMEDFKNISSSFENIYDAVDLSMQSPPADSVDVDQYMKNNLSMARTRLDKLRKQTPASVQTTQTTVYKESGGRMDEPHQQLSKSSYKPALSSPGSSTQPDLLVSSVPSQKPVDKLTRLKIASQKREAVSDGSQPGTPTSPVWYVPKPQHKYDKPPAEKEPSRKNYDAKSLIEEEQKKFEDYKREYARKLSERDSTSGTSGDEQHREQKRVIPPDDYEYILRKIHHKRQDAYYAESTSTYGTQEQNRQTNQAIKPKHSAEQSHPIRREEKEQRPKTTHQASFIPPSSSNLISSLHLPGIQHERSTSQLSTESSRELDQYFVTGKQKVKQEHDRWQNWHRNQHETAPNTDPKPTVPQQYQLQPEHQKESSQLEYGKSNSSTYIQKDVSARPQKPKENNDSMESVNVATGNVDTQWGCVQDKMKVFEKLQSVHAELRKHCKPNYQTAVDSSDAPGQYVSSKPPMPKRDDFIPQDPSQWSYNNVYKSDIPNDADAKNPSVWAEHHPGIAKPMRKDEQDLSQKAEQNHHQKKSQMKSQPRAEEYGLMLRLTPVGPLASSPSLSDSQSDNLPVKQTNKVGGNSRPVSSSFEDTNSKHDMYGSNKNTECIKDWRSQEDFQFLKDGIKYDEKHAETFRGHQKGRDHPGPAKTPPPKVDQAEIDPYTRVHPPAYDTRYKTESNMQPMSASHESLVSRKPFSVEEAKLYRNQANLVQTSRDASAHSPHRSDQHTGKDIQKSWSSRIHEVESMRPPAHQEQAEQPKELARSFALVAMAEKGKMNPQKQLLKTVHNQMQIDNVEHHTPPLERQLSSPHERSPHQSRASSQYEEHVKRTQEMYKAQTHASAVGDVEKVLFTPKAHDSEYVDPTFIRRRKSSSDSSQSSAAQNKEKNHTVKYTSSAEPRSYGLQIHVEKATPKMSSEVLLKLSRSQDDLTDQKEKNQSDPNISVSNIKNQLYGSKVEQLMRPNFKPELEKVWQRPDRKVSSIQADVFTSKDIPLPLHRSQSSVAQDDDDDERLINYVSYKDGQARKRSNIFDVLTDLERTYEKLNLDNEDYIEHADRREYLAYIQQQNNSNLAPRNTDPNVKRLSITNVKMLEDSQSNDNPSLEYAKRWIEDDTSRAKDVDSGTTKQTQFVSDKSHIQKSLPAPPSDSSQSRAGTRSSLPRKVKDDMAYRRTNRTNSLGSQPDLPESTTMSYLAKSPTVSPSQSVESLVRRAGRSKTPDAVLDDMMYRHMQRAKSPGVAEIDQGILLTKSPTSTDYLVQRTTDPARGRMRIRPERQADKYHDDFAYRQLRKDVGPIVAELPESYYAMKGIQSSPRARSHSLDRQPKDRRGRDPKRGAQVPQRSHSLGRDPALQDKTSPLSKGVGQIVTYFSQPLSHTQSAPDLTDVVFSVSYNAQGDLVSDDPKYAKHAQKMKKQQTPRTVKMRHEMKSKMKLLKHSADSGYMEQSESDASHSSSGPESHGNNQSPPGGNFDSDHDIRLSDTSSDKEVHRDVTRYKSQLAAPVVPVQRVPLQSSVPPKRHQPKSFSGTSHMPFIDDESPENKRFDTSKPKIPTDNLPPHTFVLQLPQHSGPVKDNQTRVPHDHNQINKTETYQRKTDNTSKQQPPRKTQLTKHMSSVDQPNSRTAQGFHQQHLTEIARFRRQDLKPRIEMKPDTTEKLPAPPTRMSSLVFDPKIGTPQSFQNIMQKGTPQSSAFQKPQSSTDRQDTRPDATTKYQYPREMRKSWSGPSSGSTGLGETGSVEKVEITHPATIETQSSEDVEPNIKQRYRRSWHEPPMDTCEDGKQVKVEFAFKAPDSETHKTPQVEKHIFDSLKKEMTSELQKQKQSEMSHIERPVQVRTMQSTRQVTSSIKHTRNQTDVSSTCPNTSDSTTRSSGNINQKNSEAPRFKVLNTATDIPKEQSNESLPQSPAKYELPVIRSRPQNENILSHTASNKCQIPSYTVGPITKKISPEASFKSNEQQRDPKNVDIKSTAFKRDDNVQAKPSNVSPAADRDTGSTSPKYQSTLLKKVTNEVQASLNEKPKVRKTTEIQMVASSRSPKAHDHKSVKEILPMKSIPVKYDGPTQPQKTDTKQASVGNTKDVNSPAASDAMATKHQLVKNVNAVEPEASNQRKIVTTATVEKQVVDPHSRQTVTSQKLISTRQEKVFKMALPPQRPSPRGTLSTLLSPPTGKASPALLDRMRCSPSERGFFSPPPRRSGVDQRFELSDGEMTDATDITLDGMVRSNQARPSSPETLDFSDFCDNVSESGESTSENSQQEYSLSDGKCLTPQKLKSKKMTMSKSEEQVTRRSDSSSVMTRKITRTECSSTSEHITKRITKVKDEGEPKKNSPTFKDLVKSFEAKTSPFMRSVQDAQRSASTEQIPNEVGDVSEGPRMMHNLKQMSGSDPNLSRSANSGNANQPPSPKWRRM